MGLLLAALTSLACAAASGLADEPHGVASLGEAIPADVSFYFHYRINPQGSLARHLLRVREALQSSGFVAEVSQSLMQVFLPGDGAGAREGDKKRLERESAQWQKILGGVSWWSLLSREGAIGWRGDGDQREFLLLFRTAPDETEKLLAALRQILYGICTRHPTYEMDSSAREEESVTVLYQLLDPAETLCLAGKGDVILLSSSRLLLKRSLQLLSQEGSGLGFVHSQQRAAALKKLTPRPSLDSLDAFEVHVQPAKLLPEVSALAGLEAFVMAGDATDEAIRYGFHTQFASREKGDAEDLRTAFLERPDAAFFQRIVPREARSFVATSGSEPLLLEKFLRRLVIQFLPEGEGEGILGYLEDWETSHELRFREDFLPLLTGRRVRVTGPGGTMVLLELKEPEEARRRIGLLLPKWEKTLRALGLDPKPEQAQGVEGELKTFSWTLPRGMPQVGPHWLFGTAGEYFALGTSLDLLREMLAVKAGKSPGIGESPDFVEAVPLPPGNLQQVCHASEVSSVLFLRAALALLPLLSSGLPEGDEYAITRAFLKASARLAPAAQRLTFLDREYSYLLRDGDALLGAGRILLKEITE